jgi:hypothetical protein
MPCIYTKSIRLWCHTCVGVLHESEVGSTPLVVAPAVLALIRVGTKARRGSSETQSIGVADV